jgi:hypothetical protein
VNKTICQRLKIKKSKSSVFLNSRNNIKKEKLPSTWKIRPKPNSKDQENLVSSSLKNLPRKSKGIKSDKKIKRMQSNQQ